MKRVYLAHALSAPTREGIEANRRSAARWAAWISATFRVAVSADWIWYSEFLTEAPEVPERASAKRDAALRGSAPGPAACDLR